MMEVRDTSATLRTQTAAFSVSVLLFSVLRETIGSSQIQVRVPDAARVRDVLDAVCMDYPQILAYRDAIRVGLNADYASADDPVREGDEIALITPVSGG